jgi:hypothetical protein
MFMVPVYSVEAWLSLRFIESKVYWTVMRESYEAYAIFSFTHFLLAYLGGSDADVVALLEAKDDHAHGHTPPLKWCFAPWPKGRRWLRRVKIGVLQYVVVRLFFALLSFVLELCGRFREGDFSPKYGYFWATLINNCSQMWAIYCLVLLYHCCRDDMAKIHPFRKFCCIKFVVFFSFWQAVMIAGLVRFKVVRADPSWTNWTTENIASGLQDWLITLEMLAAAALHHYAFSYTEWLDGNGGPHADVTLGPADASPAAPGARGVAAQHMSLISALVDTAVPSDAIEAAGGTLHSLRKGIRRKMGLREDSGDGEGGGGDDGDEDARPPSSPAAAAAANDDTYGTLPTTFAN